MENSRKKRKTRSRFFPEKRLRFPAFKRRVFFNHPSPTATQSGNRRTRTCTVRLLKPLPLPIGLHSPQKKPSGQKTGAAVTALPIELPARKSGDGGPGGIRTRNPKYRSPTAPDGDDVKKERLIPHGKDHKLGNSPNG